MYDHAPYAVRQDIVDTHVRAWRHIAAPGTWLTGERRVAIAVKREMPLPVPCVVKERHRYRHIRSRGNTTV